MFDADRWAIWLQSRAVDLRAFGAKFERGHPSPKPGFAFSFETSTTLSQLRVWVTGEADFEVMDLRSRQFVYHSGDLVLDDRSFEDAFEDFRARSLERV
jgi:hypothetical protein